MMKAKIHRATVTQCDLNYQGSISVDEDWLDKVGILPNEQVDVVNINTGARFTTYTIPAPRGSKTIGINGAAARLAQKKRLGHHYLLCTNERRRGQIARTVCFSSRIGSMIDGGLWGPVAQLVRAVRS